MPCSGLVAGAGERGAAEPEAEQTRDQAADGEPVGAVVIVGGV